MTAETVTPNSDVTALSDRELIEQIHAIVTELAPLVEHMPRLMALLDPFAKVRRGRRGRDAFPFSAATPLHVGPTPQDRRPVDPQIRK